MDKLFTYEEGGFVQHVEDVTLEDLQSCVSCVSGLRENCLFVFPKGGTKDRRRLRKGGSQQREKKELNSKYEAE